MSTRKKRNERKIRNYRDKNTTCKIKNTLGGVNNKLNIAE